MRKNDVPVIAALTLLVSACVAPNSDQQDIRTVNYNELSCEQIDLTFANYQAMIKSSNVITDLISLASPSVGMVANKTKSSAELGRVDLLRLFFKQHSNLV